MKRAYLAFHLGVPVLFAVYGFVFTLNSERSPAEAFGAVLLGGSLFYSAPHILWAGVCAIVKPAVPIWHAGFTFASAVLVCIGAMSFVSHDPSGLPLHWLLYWPIAGVMFVAVAVAWHLTGRPRAHA